MLTEEITTLLRGIVHNTFTIAPHETAGIPREIQNTVEKELDWKFLLTSGGTQLMCRIAPTP
jgi:hypothetical protein